MSDIKGPQDASQLEERLSLAPVANFAGSLGVKNLDVAPMALVVRGNKGKAAVWLLILKMGGMILGFGRLL